ncbi:hypothetical protein DM860_016938 [Cuscuta australis]|uniref:MSP domain-containing protein n=2 Tax=Cuscuta sect. Cleistogrammica TaxID=1824901 RepID=A0A328E203_9ASTE|nr:hypothetical protein DM860_016938 [Cuscuta australis]
MHFELVDIHPRDVKFIFEPRRQSSCTTQLINKTDKTVAFKVKTTNPKKYCVRPNAGIISSKSSCEFKIIMQAQQEPPPDMVCKDKFLVQSKVVPDGTSDKDITSETFSKDDGKYVQENKLRVVLVSPNKSPVISQVDGARSIPLNIESSPPKWLGDFIDGEPQVTRQRPANKGVKQEYQVDHVEEKFPEIDPTKDVEKAKRGNDINARKSVETNLYSPVILQTDGGHGHPVDFESSPPKWLGDHLNVETQLPPQTPAEEAVEHSQEESAETEHCEIETIKGVEEREELENEINAMKSMLNALELKLSEAEATISKLTEETRVSAQEKESLRAELAKLRERKAAVRKVEVGFPLLFVVMVALVSLLLGYIINQRHSKYV